MATVDVLPSLGAARVAGRSCLVSASVAAASVGLLAARSLALRSASNAAVSSALPEVRPSAALVLLLLALALAATNHATGRPALRTLGRLSSALAMLAGALDLAGLRSAGAVSWFAIGGLLLGTALWIAGARTRRAQRIAEVFSLSALVIATVGFFGNALRGELGLGIEEAGGPRGMTFGAAAGLFVLSVGSICAMPASRFVTRVSSGALGGIVARRLLLGVLALPIASLAIAGVQRMFLVDAGRAATFLATAAMVAAMVVFYATARAIDRMDRERTRGIRDLAHAKLFFDAAPHAGIVADADGRIVLANEAARKLRGSRAGAPAVTRVTDLLAPESRAQWEDQQALLLREGHTHFEAEVVDDAGVRLPVKVEATSSVSTEDALRYRVLSLDPIEPVPAPSPVGEEPSYRELFEDAANDRLRLEAILDHLPDGVLVVDAEGNLIAKNRAADALSATPREVAPSSSDVFIDLRTADGERLDPDDLPLNRLLRLGSATRAKELSAVLRDGRSIPLLVNVAEVHAARGALIGAVETFQDISALKDIERMREEWGSVIAHDLRQPLHSIEMSAELLDKAAGALGVRTTVRPYIDRIEGAVGRLDRMIQDLSDISRIEARRLTLHVSEIDLLRLASDVIDRFGSEAEWISLRHDGTPRPLLADPDRVDQVLTNLLSNALKYGDRDAPVVLSILYGPTAVDVSVTNHGPGISPEAQERVFQRFERARATSDVRGLGLGLYICRGLIEAHGGHIRVESRIDETTTFTFALPYEPKGLLGPGPRSSPA